MKGQRTTNELANEINLLRQLRDKVPAQTWFGGDNRGAIDAQIRVLEERMTADAIVEQFEEKGVQEHIFSNALNAHDWLNRIHDELGSLSEGWASMIEAKLVTA